MKDAEIENNWMGIAFGSIPILINRNSFPVFKGEKRTTFTGCLLYAKLCA